jgi:acyl-CoA reductase-like NAD-dependent aldehyde dehydrogenase
MKQILIDRRWVDGAGVTRNVNPSDQRDMRLAREEGATVAFGGERLDLDRPGYYLQPALITDARNDMRSCREEIFGPVAHVIHVPDGGRKGSSFGPREQGRQAVEFHTVTKTAYTCAGGRRPHPPIDNTGDKT